MLRTLLGALNPGADKQEIEEAIDATRSILARDAAIQATFDVESTGASVSDIATFATERYAQCQMAAELKDLPEVGANAAPAYDTLDDIAWFGDVQSLHGLYEAFFHNIFNQPEPFFGDLCCGTISAEDWPAGEGWGVQCMQWPDHPETWRARSSPPGRAGKPLERGEVRRTAFLVRNRDRPAEGFVVTMRLEMVPTVTAEMLDGTDPRIIAQNTRHTWGPHGVNMLGVSVFAHHGHAYFSQYPDYVQNAHGFHSVLGSYIDQCENGCTLFVSEGFGNFALAGAIGGFSIRDNCHHIGYESLPWDRHQGRVKGQEKEFLRQFEHFNPHEPNPITAAWALLHAAQQVAERYSYAGLLDNLCDPFYKGALPNGMYHPNQLGVLIVMATRMVTHPDRFGGVNKPSRIDLYAASEFEAMLTSVLPIHKTDTDGMPVFAIDMIMHMYYMKRSKRVADLSAEQRHDDGESIRRYQEAHCELMDGLNVLYRAGAVVLNSVCDVAGREYTEGVVDANGSEARQCHDSVTFGRYRAVVEWLPSLAMPSGTNPPARQTTRGARQQALIKLCCNVERMLQDYTFLNRRLDPQARASHAAASGASGAGGAGSAGSARAPDPAPVAGGKKARARAQRADKLARNAQRESREQLARAARGDEFGLPFDARGSAACTKMLDKVFERGLSRGASDASGVEVFVLSRLMKLQCANCTNEVHCIASLGLGGRVHNCCVHCQRPRCLHCVEKLFTGQYVPMADAHGHCLFCPDREV
jgi:hypothetical protein